jgi:hypothetical protein
LHLGGAERLAVRLIGDVLIHGALQLWILDPCLKEGAGALEQPSDRVNLRMLIHDPKYPADAAGETAGPSSSFPADGQVGIGGHPARPPDRLQTGATMSATILWIIAAILVIVGIVQLLQGQILFGVLLIIVGCLVGPGGYSITRSRT